MTAWRVSLIVGLLLAAVSSGRAQTCTLAETLKPGDCFRYGIEMKLTGEMRYVGEDAKLVPVKMSAQGKHAFPERVLTVAGGVIQKSARVYDRAVATIQRGRDQSENGLRPSRKLIVAQRHKDQHLVYSPAGALTRSELEVVSEHFDTLLLTGVLPGKAVKVGDTWKLSSAAAAALCSIEGMTGHKLTGKLDRVTAKLAAFSIKGTAAGVWQGAQLKTSIDATGTFDLKTKRIIKLVWKQKDDRDQGPVSPASPCR